MTNNSCNICTEIAGYSNFGSAYQKIINSKNNVLLETSNLLVIPSAGPLCDTHVMIVPKNHSNSFAALASAQQKEKLEVIERLKKYSSSRLNKNLVFFESGAGIRVDLSGGCIAHAHIHAIEAQETFHRRLLEEVSLVEVDDSYTNNADLINGYIWYMDGDGQQYLCNRPMLPSQFLRYSYAQGLRSALMWNWRRHLNLEGLTAVISNYSSLSLQA